jgi:hypothetical protein
MEHLTKFDQESKLVLSCLDVMEYKKVVVRNENEKNIVDVEKKRFLAQNKYFSVEDFGSDASEIRKQYNACPWIYGLNHVQFFDTILKTIVDCLLRLILRIFSGKFG